MSTRVQARYRTAAGTLGPIVDIATLGASSPQVSMLPNGQALIVYRAWDGSYYRIHARTLSRSGTLGPPELISEPGRDADLPQIATDEQGHTVIDWRVGGRIKVLRRTRGGNLSRAKTLSPRPDSSSPGSLAVDADGDAVIAWRAVSSEMVGVRRTAGGAIGTTETLGVPPTLGIPDVAIDPDGDATVAWAGNTGGQRRIISRSWSADGTVAPPDTINTASTTESPLVEMGPDGDALIIWGDGGDEILARERSAAGPLGPQETIASEAQGVVLAATGVDASGDVEIVWRRKGRFPASYGDARERLESGALAPIQNVFPKTQSLSSNQPRLTVAVAADGTALAGYTRPTPSSGYRALISTGP